MRPTSVDALREEVMALGALILHAPLVHPAGVPLHPEGTVLSIPRLGALKKAGFTQLFLLEPGETPESARKALATETLPPARLRPGDRLEEDLRAPDGALLAAAGSAVDARLIEAALQSGLSRAVIRTRGLEHAVVLVREYVNSLPPQTPSRGLRWDGALTPLLVPRAKVAVSVQAALHREAILAALASEGHEAQGVTAADAARLLRLQQADVAIVDASDAPGLQSTLFDPTRSRTGALLALSVDTKGAAVERLLKLGINDVIPSPPVAISLIEKVMNGLQAGGRRARTAPAVQTERRAKPRAPESATCRVVDQVSGTAPPVSSIEVLDRSETGMRIAYRSPDRKDAQWTRGRSVHPLHFLYPYAQVNGLGNDLLVSIPSPGRPPFEARARVVWIALRKDQEEAGLVFRKGMTTVRRPAF